MSKWLLGAQPVRKNADEILMKWDATAWCIMDSFIHVVHFSYECAMMHNTSLVATAAGLVW